MNQTDFAAALALNPRFNGEGTTVEMNTDFALPDNAVIRDTTFVDINPQVGVARRILYKSGGAPVTLDRVKFNRGSNKLAGKMGTGFEDTSAALWLHNVPNVRLDIEVTGHGRGVGLYVQDCKNLFPINPINIYGMQFESATALPAGTKEQMIGVWMNYWDTGYESRWHLESPRIRDLTSKIAGVERAYQTDAIACGGSFLCSISNPQIGNVGEGIDFTGSRGNTCIEVHGGNFWDIDSFGIKVACTGQWGLIHDINLWNCGYSAVVASGSVSSEGTPTNELLFHHINAFNTGSNGHWSAYNVAAFSVMQGSHHPTYPQGVVFESCTARDFGSTMKYGFRNENNSTTNKLRGDWRSIGHTMAATSGTWG